MSAPIDAGSSEAVAGAENISAGAGGDATGTADSGRSPTDYIQQVRTNPDFAEKEVRNLKSRYDSADAERNKMVTQLGPLMPYLEGGVNGQQIVDHVQKYADIDSDPELSKMIENYKANRAAGSSTTDGGDDEYLTPEQEEIRALKAELGEVKGRQARTDLTFGTDRLKSGLTKVASDIGLPPEIHKRVMGKMAQKIDVWGQNFAKGDQTAMSALKQLQGAESDAFIRTMIMNELDQPNDFEEVARYRQLRKKGNARRFETDGPPEIATTGQEPPPDPSQFKNAAEAARWARDNPERHDSY